MFKPGFYETEAGNKVELVAHRGSRVFLVDPRGNGYSEDAALIKGPWFEPRKYWLVFDPNGKPIQILDGDPGIREKDGFTVSSFTEDKC